MARSNTWTTLLVLAAISLTVLARPKPSNGSGVKPPTKKISTNMEREMQAKKLQKAEDKYLDNMAETLVEWLVESNDLEKLQKRVERSDQPKEANSKSENLIDDDYAASKLDDTSRCPKDDNRRKWDATKDLVNDQQVLKFDGGCKFQIEKIFDENDDITRSFQVICQCDASCTGGTCQNVVARISSPTKSDPDAEMEVNIGCACIPNPDLKKADTVKNSPTPV